MSKYTLFGETIEFSAAAERYIKLHMAVSSAVQGAKNDFFDFYEKSGNISNVLDGYADILVSITYNWAIQPLFKTFLTMGIYDVSQDQFEEECWDLSGAEEYYDVVADAYNEIVGGYEASKTYRSARKATRSRVVGGGFGVDGALKGMVTAGAMNTVTGLGHSAVNAIGNIASSIKASSEKSSLYNSNDTLQMLACGVKQCIIDIFFEYHSFVNNYQDETWYDGSQFDIEKSNTILKNVSAVPQEKCPELLINSFIRCPFNEDLLRYIFLNYEKERKSIFQIAQKYRVDLNNDLLEILCEEYCNSAKKICSAIAAYQPEFSDDEKEEILTAFCEKASLTLEVYETKLSEIHDIMKALQIEDSEALDVYEFNVLSNIAEDYEKLPFDGTDEIISTIIACKVSDNAKKELIYDRNIWELFAKYDVTIPEDEKLSLLYDKYQKMLLVKNISDDQIKEYLDKLLQAINFNDKSGSITYDTKEKIFETLTGISNKKTNLENDIENLQNDMLSDINTTIESLISSSGITFMTTSLTYKLSSLNTVSKNLSYCELNSNEHPLMIYDERPLMYPGEFGFCFTDKRFVGKPEYGNIYDIPAIDILSFEIKDASSRTLTMHTKNEKYTVNVANLSELTKFTDCLNQVLSTLLQNGKDIDNQTKTLNKELLDTSIEYIEKNPLLVEFFNMQDKVEGLYEVSGKKFEQQRIIESCTDENLELCGILQLESYLSSIKNLRISDKEKTLLCEKVNNYIDLIHSCKDKLTVKLLDLLNDSQIDGHDPSTLVRLRSEVESHEFLDADTKRDLINKITPRIHLVTFKNKLRNAQNNYQGLVELYSSLNNEPLSPDVIAQFKQQLNGEIIHLQETHLSNLLVDLDSMAHYQVIYAIGEAQLYAFDNTLLQKTLEPLYSKRNELENQILSDFCSKIDSASLAEIENFKKRLTQENFDIKNIGNYSEIIDQKYNGLMFEKICCNCKQTIISKLATTPNELNSLLSDFEKYKPDDASAEPYIQRITALTKIQAFHDNALESTRSSGENLLISYVSNEITTSVLPQTKNCYIPEVYIQGNLLNEYSEYDNCKNSYAEDEFAIFYIFQLDGKNRIPNTNITNKAMYLSKSSSNGQIIRIPLENIMGLKPSRMFNSIAVNTPTSTANIYSELPYKQKMCLSNAITNIVEYVVRNKNKMQQELSDAHNNYLSAIAECFKNHPIPCDDNLNIPVPKPVVQHPAANNINNSSAMDWTCKCGKKNTGNFCSACGTKKEDCSNEWICSCGSVNNTNFCPSCGKGRS